jgi:23S rRNA (cytidine1920-2'-O)/16S rRNA (cytidine1409-2'-O)-methyltransferase
MAARRRTRFIALTLKLSLLGVDRALDVISRGRVLVDGRVVTNPSAQVRSDATIRILPERRLKGDVKLSFALERLVVHVDGLVALDLGASAGGFTTAMLARGARRVYAVDAGTGQLRSALQEDPRVVDLEGHNLGVLDANLVPEPIDLVTMDVGYLALATAIPQLDRIRFRSPANLLALVKPTFELRRGAVANSAEDIGHAVSIVTRAMANAGWNVVGQCQAPMTGRRHSQEAFLLGRREA